jgi:hypothetical protein
MDLEAVETMRFGSLHAVREVVNKAFVNSSIGGGKEGESVWGKVALVVMEVLECVHLLCRPGRGRGHVHLHIDVSNCSNCSRYKVRSQH